MLDDVKQSFVFQKLPSRISYLVPEKCFLSYINLHYRSTLQCIFTRNNNNLIQYVTLQGWQSLLPFCNRQLINHVFPHMWPKRHGYKVIQTLEISETTCELVNILHEISGTMCELVNILHNIVTLKSPVVATRTAIFKKKIRNFSHTSCSCVPSGAHNQ